MKKNIIMFLVFTCAMLLCPLLSPGESKDRITGIYSNMYCNPETYDIVGMELFIVKSTAGYHGLVQIAEGEPEKPFLVNITIKGNHIEFNTPGPPAVRPDKFIGEIGKTGIKGKWIKPGMSVFLKKGRSFWQD